MTDKYTPTTEEIEAHWADVGFAGDRASFQRWLAAHEAAIRADERAKVLGKAESDLQYGVGWEYPPFPHEKRKIFGYVMPSREEAEEHVREEVGPEEEEDSIRFLVRRTPALPPGPWERVEYHVTDLKDGTIHVLDAPPPPSSEERLVKRRAVRTVEP